MPSASTIESLPSPAADVDGARRRGNRLVASYRGVEVDIAVEARIAGGEAVVAEQPARLRNRQVVTRCIPDHRRGRTHDGGSVGREDGRGIGQEQQAGPKVRSCELDTAYS